MSLRLNYRILLTLFLLLLSGLMVQAQEIKGRVIDKNTQKPLPFVNIVYNDKNQGLTSDIDGWFHMSESQIVDYLKFSYVGYNQVIFSRDEISAKKLFVVKMTEKVFDINEVTVFPGENPAHRIIKKVLENRKINNPENLSTYSYTSYNKMYFTFEFDKDKKPVTDTLSTDSLTQDPGLKKVVALLNKQHLFFMESVSERIYKKPGKINEKVVASRVSGFKDPSFVLLATQMQSFSFYDDMITLLESRYVNPISNGSTKRYFFNIEDTTLTETGDTVFSISFRPKKNKNFEGLKGVLNINVRGYAIQSVMAEPTEDNGLMNIRIQQNYELIDGKHWFPKELNTDIIFINMAVTDIGKHKAVMVGVGKSYIDDIKLNNSDDNKKFSAIEVNVDDAAFKQNDSFWNQYRRDSLSIQELRTYEVIDSLGNKHKFDRKLKVLKTISTGYIPYHFIDIQVLSLFDFNVYEGYRPGVGLKTNDKVSSFFSVGGYAAYGFNDEQWKYGGNLDFNISARQEIKLGLSYKNDVIESSGYQFFEEKKGFNSTESYRYFFIKDMTYSEGYSANLEFRALKGLKVNLFASSVYRKNTSQYYFADENTTDNPSSVHLFQEMGAQFKFAPNESKAFVAGELFSENPLSSPILYLNFIKGFKNGNSHFDYTKLEAKLDFNFLTKTFGRTYIQLVGGKVIGDLPYYLLYNGHASYYDFAVETANSFATMRMNEFLSDEFASFHFRQDFGSLIFRTKKFKPEVLLTTSIGFGRLQKPELHNAIEFNTLEKGFYESGLQINNLLMYFKMIGLGVGIYYRYGSYSYSNNSDNFAYKFTMTFKL